jgi:hypothetical protein
MNKENELTKKVIRYRRFLYGFITISFLLLALCFYDIFQWRQEKIARIINEELYTHYRQQWIDTVAECSKYRLLYENYQNSNSSGR